MGLGCRSEVWAYNGELGRSGLGGWVTVGFDFGGIGFELFWGF